nr:bifunctional molybdenum cofactor biosynthesis protein MoaC/MoaB [Rothia kristinae]
MTHVRADGSAHMVDVTGKAETSRQAVAEGILRTRPEVVDLIWAGDLPKGDALPVARVAGIMGAKRTPEIIPLCHPLSLGKITVDFQRLPDGVRIEALVRTRGVTGVEMEALTAVSAAALALYDMIKAVDRHAAIEGIRVLAKSGGKSGDWSLPAPRADPAPPHRTLPEHPASRRAPFHRSAHLRGARMSADVELTLPQTALVVVASTRAARGEYPDRSGPIAVQWLRSRGFQTPDPVVVSDEEVTAYLDGVLSDRERLPRLVITSGGTGLNRDDRTVEAVRPHLDHEVPGIMHALWAKGLESTPAAVLSRGVAGTIGQSFVVTLPGSRGGVRDGVAVLDSLLDHLLRQLEDYHDH